MTNLIASPTQMAHKIRELEERIIKLEELLAKPKVKDGRKSKKNDLRHFSFSTKFRDTGGDRLRKLRIV